jgi:hypothetical protein
MFMKPQICERFDIIEPNNNVKAGPTFHDSHYTKDTPNADFKAVPYGYEVANLLSSLNAKISKISTGAIPT